MPAKAGPDWKVSLVTAAGAPITSATQYAEDAAHASGDMGTMALGVQQATQAALAAAGDYVPFLFDPLGSARMVAAGYTDVISGVLTRPANMDAYAAEDEVATATTVPLSLSLARYNGGTGLIVGATVIYSSTPTTIPQFRLLFFDQTVTLAGDNAAIALSDAHAAFGIGLIDVVTTQGAAAATAGSLICVGAPTAPIAFRAQSGVQTIFVALITKNAWTPIANSETLTIRVRVEQN